MLRVADTSIRADLCPEPRILHAFLEWFCHCQLDGYKDGPSASLHPMSQYGSSMWYLLCLPTFGLALLGAGRSGEKRIFTTSLLALVLASISLPLGCGGSGGGVSTNTHNGHTVRSISGDSNCELRIFGALSDTCDHGAIGVFHMSTARARAGWQPANHYESEIALFYECIQNCARKRAGHRRHC